MTWKNSYLLLVVILMGCKKQAEEQTALGSEYLIEANQLKDIIGQPGVKIIDFRKELDYKEQHIAGALQMWRDDIEDSSFPYKGMMPNKIALAKLFGELGIHQEDMLVIYDNNGLCEASRLWWILQNYDFQNVKLLIGGLDAWQAIGGTSNTEIPENIETEFQFSESPSMKYYASMEDIQKAIAQKKPLVDTRTKAEFDGIRQKKGAAKAGRIPNSIHIDWAEAINYHGDQQLKSIAALEGIYDRMKTQKEDTSFVYCHTGVRSAHTTFVLTQLLGYKNIRNYDGSWTEWSQFEKLPFEKDSITTIID